MFDPYIFSPPGPPKPHPGPQFPPPQKAYTRAENPQQSPRRTPHPRLCIFLLSLRYETIRHDPRPVLRRDIPAPGRKAPSTCRPMRESMGMGGIRTTRSPPPTPSTPMPRRRLSHASGSGSRAAASRPTTATATSPRGNTTSTTATSCSRGMAPVPDRRAQQQHEAPTWATRAASTTAGPWASRPCYLRVRGAACRGRRAGRRPERAAHPAARRHRPLHHLAHRRPAGRHRRSG